jgi:hypothetical protein
MKTESYSQCGQDLFVFNLIKNKGQFLDLGCYLPKKINNTYLLELNGWNGVSVDIIDYSEQWKERSTQFINQDCFNIDFEKFLPNYFDSKTIDYLSLDMEKIGERYKLLQKILNNGYDFKVITIEHDSYLGHEFESNEKIPQREILTNNGYVLVCSDVSQKNHPTLYYEDWWVNKKYFTEDETSIWFSDKISCDKIFTKAGVDYLVNEISQSW